MDRLELPRDAVPSCTSGCPSGIRLAAAPGQGNRQKRGYLDLPDPHDSSGGFDLFSRGQGSGLGGAWSLPQPPLVIVFPKVPLAQALWWQLGSNQTGERRSQSRARWARSPG